MSKQFTVEYIYGKPDTVSGTRARITGSSASNLEGSESDFAVVAFLQRKHPGNIIVPMKITWSGK